MGDIDAYLLPDAKGYQSMLRYLLGEAGIVGALGALGLGIFFVFGGGNPKQTLNPTGIKVKGLHGLHLGNRFERCL